ncbi:MAG: ribokinase family sugar kinase [Chlorobi bacterium OLB7]|nr:MAG: ribokinase family sugar kinase [Chlorobi bacterium OLB7]
MLFIENEMFSAPAYPLEELYDPTGAGDTFAGGFIGYLARAGAITEATLRRAVIYGSAMASFCVQQFSLDAIKDLSNEEIQQRAAAFRAIAEFDLDEVELDDAAV